MSIKNGKIKGLLIMSVLIFTFIPLCSYAEDSSYPSYYYLLSSVPVTINISQSQDNTYQKFMPYPKITLHKGQLLALEIKVSHTTKIRLTTSKLGLITEELILPEKIFFCPLTQWEKKDINLDVIIEVMSIEISTIELVLKTFQIVYSSQPKGTITALSFYEGVKDQFSVIGVILPPIEIQAVLQLTISPVPKNITLNNIPLQKSPDGKIRVQLSKNALYMEFLVNGSVSWVLAVVRYFYSLTPSTEKQNSDVLLGTLSVLLFLIPLVLRHHSIQKASNKRVNNFSEKHK